MWRYNYSNELYHYGVLGMKWGRRKYQNKDGSLTPAGEKRYAKLEKKVSKKYAKAGRKAGEAAYQRDKGDREYEQHKKAASAFDKAAKKYEKEGNYFKAEASRRASEAIKTRGENKRAERYEMADYYMKRSNKLKEKANTFATKKKVDMGKSKVDSILKQSKQKGYENAKDAEEFQKEMNVQRNFGDTGADIYRYAKGR